MNEFYTESFGPIQKYNFIKFVPEMRTHSGLSVYRIGNTIFDTGSLPASAFLLKELKKNPPKQVILSHQHEDHIGGLKAIKEEFGDIPVYCPKEHIKIIQTGYKVPAYRQAYWGDIKPVSNLIPYDENTEFTEGAYRIQVIPSPGHTPGHRSFIIRTKEETYIHTGDLYISPRLPNAFYETSVPDMIHSLESLLTIKENFAMLPSHGSIYLDAKKRLLQLLNWYKKETEVILSLADSLHTKDYNRIFKERYKSYNAIELASKGELGRLALIRGIIEPVTSLPASPICLDPELLEI